MDTAANVHAYNTGSVETAKAEAAELQEALANGASSQGRTPEEILDQIDKHRDIPTYALAFCQTMGVDNMLDAPLEAQKDTNYALQSQPAIIDRMVDTFGHVMCAASTLYDETSYQPPSRLHLLHTSTPSRPPSTTPLRRRVTRAAPPCWMPTSPLTAPSTTPISWSAWPS
ncbi:DUF6571 family protein [Actinomyces ruminis]|uniref:DUF6571 domain-containing protein n=1 Tax=Actinomyces ruminis TaxID=1937003 RepID=A0ABX4MDS9_9ACTO|nr:DUF6571 family protein [Actinomyces ruminis]PHP53588.1 hypothetical protein BW737_001765 [Actinomyces ruminis]